MTERRHPPQFPKLVGLLGVDTGGTFTDFFWLGPQGARTHKVLSTPEAPEQAVLQGIEELGLARDIQAGGVLVVHGTTVATNAALEGKGVRTVFVTNSGFKDLLTLGRQNRPDIYALQPAPMSPPAPEWLCLEVNCRRDAQGQELVALTDKAITNLVRAVTDLVPQAVAINLLFSYRNGEDEQRLLRALPPELFVCASSDVLPEYGEYERGMATWLNAWLGPKVAQCIKTLEQRLRPSPLAVMQSSGGTVGAKQASNRAVNLLLSGPAGGLAAARFVGEQIGRLRLMTFDMGGTSTDVALIDGDIRLTSEGRLGEYPVAVPMVDMHTIGAGGGSIAYLDAGGLLHVGPQSAGAQPGPACYGRGGTQATVTDANAVLGRLRPALFLGGRMVLDIEAARKAVATAAEAMGVTLEVAAEGILALANEHMAKALRVISVQKGFNPAEFDLCCFGGAGGLHVCALAEELGMTSIVVPAHGGVLSAFGMLVAPRQRNLSRSLTTALHALDLATVQSMAAELEQAARAELAEEGVSGELNCRISLDCRYLGQSFYLNLPWPGSLAEVEASFHREHRNRYGHSLPLPVELVNVRVQLTAPSTAQPAIAAPEQLPGRPIEELDLPCLGHTQVWRRADLALGQVIEGPAVIGEEVATTLVARRWRAELDKFGHLRMRRTD